MNVLELERSLRQLRLGGMATVLETRLRQAQAEAMTHLDLISLSGLGRTHTSRGSAPGTPPQNRPPFAISTRLRITSIGLSIPK